MSFSFKLSNRRRLAFVSVSLFLVLYIVWHTFSLSTSNDIQESPSLFGQETKSSIDIYESNNPHHQIEQNEHIPSTTTPSFSTTTSNSIAVPADVTSTTNHVQECTVSFDGQKPVTQYVLMIDAGSTGSRVHVYQFNNCNPSPKLEEEYFKMIEPGLSSFAGNPDGAAASLNPLLEFALEHVPDEHKKCSPIAVKATAGLRLTGESEARAILNAVKSHLLEDYPFPLAGKDSVSILDGAMEGVYAWVTINYLLGSLNVGSSESTVAVMDLGGASTQLVFEPHFPNPQQKLSEGDHKYVLEYNNRQYELYQFSHLGYGLKEARKLIHKIVVNTADILRNSLDTDDVPYEITHPCLHLNASMQHSSSTKDGGSVNFAFKGPSLAHSSLQCRAFAEKVLYKEKECQLAPCSFNGVHQPKFTETFNDAPIYLISYFYDRLIDLGMPSTFTIEDMKYVADRVCSGPDSWLDAFSLTNSLGALKQEPEWCLDLNYMISLLSVGYEIPNNRQLYTAKKINNKELGWCLGASLSILSESNGEFKCTITEEAL
ncbi:guanosine-diphosphatase Gda1 [Schizosaccharomyces cryophilus OY26]|uniref:guanosine-diphosphatase n=1 Tax=Schizosaccharomyces cryophilus (strain OY26 / ATCC MYA-4695 / CBS 11777 / NBRC 106824 / NRRL Y48691) TaxID=653667 RepID=S9WY86_SCHCR|nr:guanosine-diphosphatase Gda1 [Schizosaccharomyces cryophilus OY26]EPY49692.1 guanosine-diphosphatase Gda1 [Schizosaccharomyces cryophilus OY26]